jgi:hypothetical protein
MQLLRASICGAVFLASAATAAFASDCSPDTMRTDEKLADYAERTDETIATNDAAAIYDLYQGLTNREADIFRLFAKLFVSDLISKALKAADSSPPDTELLRAALVVLANLPIWRSCDTQADAVRIALAVKDLAARDEKLADGLDAAATAAIRRADGQLTPLLRKEHSSPAEFDATLAQLAAILDEEAFKDTGYHDLVASSLANKRQEGFFWHVGFETPFADIWAKTGNTRRCAPNNLACIYLRDASRQIDGFLADLKGETSPAEGDGYFLRNDFIFMRAINHVLSNELDQAEELTRKELIEAERNAETGWYDPERPLDHVYVYKYLRDPDERGACAEFRLVDLPTNRCPVKEFYNPVQLGEHLLTAIEDLKSSGAAQKMTPHMFDNFMRQFINRDYRVVLDISTGDTDPEKVPYPEQFSAVLSEKDTADWTCPAATRALTQANSPTICLSSLEHAPGLYQLQYFVGGGLTAAEGEALIKQITGTTRLPFRPYLLRPPVKG